MTSAQVPKPLTLSSQPSWAAADESELLSLAVVAAARCGSDIDGLESILSSMLVDRSFIVQQAKENYALQVKQNNAVVFEGQ